MLIYTVFHHGCMRMLYSHYFNGENRVWSSRKQLVTPYSTHTVPRVKKDQIVLVLWFCSPADNKSPSCLLLEKVDETHWFASKTQSCCPINTHSKRDEKQGRKTTLPLVKYSIQPHPSHCFTVLKAHIPLWKSLVLVNLWLFGTCWAFAVEDLEWF